MNHDITCVVSGGIGGLALATEMAMKHKLKLVLLEEGKESKLVEFKLPQEKELERIKGDVNLGVTCVAGFGYESTIVATALSSRYDLNLLMVRDKPKQHGKKSLLDGYDYYDVGAKGERAGEEKTEEIVEIIGRRGIKEETEEGLLRTVARESGMKVMRVRTRVELERNEETPILPTDRVGIIDDVLTTGGSIFEMIEKVKETNAWISGWSVVFKRGEVDIRKILGKESNAELSDKEKLAENEMKKRLTFVLRPEEILAADPLP